MAVSKDPIMTADPGRRAGRTAAPTIDEPIAAGDMDFGQGALASLCGVLAERMEGIGVYLDEEHLAAIADRAAEFVRRYPVQCLAAAATVGFVLGRLRR